MKYDDIERDRTKTERDLTRDKRLRRAGATGRTAVRGVTAREALAGQISATQWQRAWAKTDDAGRRKMRDQRNAGKIEVVPD